MNIRSEDVKLEVELPGVNKPLVLNGVVRFLAGHTPVASVIIHPGSGPTDRDGNNNNGLNTDCYKQLACELAGRNIAVLCIDKRGVGRSVSPAITEQLLTIDDYADDFLRWQSELEARYETPVFLIGHSEGALIASLTAQKSESTVAIVLLCATSQPLRSLLLEQLKKQSPLTVSDAEIAIDRLAAGYTDIDFPPELSYLFRPSAQPYMVSCMKYDPCQVLADLKIPCFIISGTEDVQVSPQDTQRLAGVAAMAEYQCIEGMGHTLKRSNRGSDSLEPYKDPTLPVSVELVEQICQFINNNAGQEI